MSYRFVVRTVTVCVLAASVPTWAQVPASAPSAAEPERAASGRHVPDLSGVWMLERVEGNLPERAVSALGAGSVPPVMLTITQTAAQVSIRRNVDHRLYVSVFPLSGVEAVQDTPQGPMKSRARWDDSVLIIEGTRPLPWLLGKRQVPFQQQHRVNEAGHTMTVEVVLQTPRGPKTRTAIFRRAGE